MFETYYFFMLLPVAVILLC